MISNQLKIRDVLLVLIFVYLSAFLNASMDITYHNFKASIYSQISEEGTPTYKYFQSHWTNKWLTNEEGELVLDEEGNRIPRWWLGIEVVPFNHPLFFDSWHLFKSAMIAMLILAFIFMYFAKHKVVFSGKRWQSWVVAGILFVFYTINWNLMFNLFYDNWLRL